MPNLGDYLGQLMAEISMARFQADLETVRLAELYASHPLLRHMPVPHIRLPDVDLDIPVLIREATPPRDGETARGGVPRTALRQKFDSVLQSYLQGKGVKLTSPQESVLAKSLDALSNAPALPVEVSIDVNRTADEFARTAASTLKDVMVPARSGEASATPAIDPTELQRDARLAFLQLRTAPPRLDVAVTSSEIRAGATNDNIARIHMKIAEHGVEWTTIQRNGDSRDLLVPE